MRRILLLFTLLSACLSTQAQTTTKPTGAVSISAGWFRVPNSSAPSDRSKDSLYVETTGVPKRYFYMANTKGSAGVTTGYLDSLLNANYYSKTIVDNKFTDESSTRSSADTSLSSKLLFKSSVVSPSAIDGTLSSVIVPEIIGKSVSWVNIVGSGNYTVDSTPNEVNKKVSVNYNTGEIISPMPLYGGVYAVYSKTQIGSTPTNLTPNYRLQSSDNVQSSDVLSNSIWNQWIQPRAVVDQNGDMYVTGVGNGSGDHGQLFLYKRGRDGRTVRKLIGRIQSTLYLTDDHAAASILLDKRPGATYPIMIFQVDHGTSKIRVCKLTSYDPDTWVFNWTDVTTATYAYTQVFRNNDEILLVSRRGSTRATTWIYSTDNGITFKTKEVFKKAGEQFIYFLFKEKADASGINIFLSGHPIQSTDQGIYFVELNWNTGAVVSPANRSTPLIPNFKTIFDDAGFVAINPFDPTKTLQLYLPSGTKRKRFWDGGNSVTGECIIAYQEVPDLGGTMALFNASRSKVLSFNLGDGTINYNVEVGETGMPNERPVETNLYFSGMVVINPKKVGLLVYKNQSMIDGGNDVVASDGVSEGFFIDLTNPSALIMQKFTRSNAKLMRPIVTPDSQYILYNEANNYLTYDGSDIISHTVIEKVSDIK